MVNGYNVTECNSLFARHASKKRLGTCISGDIKGRVERTLGIILLSVFVDELRINH